MSSRREAPMERILLATDFSQWTTGAVEVAFSLARSFGAEVFMVHGIEPIAGGGEEAEAVDEDDEGFDEFFGDLMERAKTRLEALVEEAADEGISARFHIEIGQRWRIILDQADQEEVDLIVMGRRAYIDHSDIRLGTTSQRVYFGTSRAVMTVPLSDVSQSEGDS